MELNNLPSSKRSHPIERPYSFHPFSRPYCIHTKGLIVVAVGMALIVALTLTLSTYVFYDIVLKRREKVPQTFHWPSSDTVAGENLDLALYPARAQARSQLVREVDVFSHPDCSGTLPSG